MRWRLPWLLVAIICTLVPAAHANTAKPSGVSEATISGMPDGVSIAWQGNVDRAANGQPTMAGWERVTIGATSMPARLVALRVGSLGIPDVRISRLESIPWHGTITAAPRPAPGMAPAGRADLATRAAVTLPDRPITILRDGMIRGSRVVVLALHPIFGGDRPRAATRVEAFVPGATLFDGRALPEATPFTPLGVASPINKDAARQTWVIEVEHEGLQVLDAPRLARVGLDLATITVANLHLRWRGQEIALEERRDALGQRTGLAFVAPRPGDRWNQFDAYWLALEATPGLRMAQRETQLGNAPVRSTALASGAWHGTKLYDSTLPGHDGDHWFGADLRVVAGTPSAPFSVPLSSTLPLATGTTTVTLAVAGYTRGQHVLALNLGSVTREVRWEGAGDQVHTLAIPATDPAIHLSATPAASNSGMLLDTVEWRAPVRLDFGNRGAFFDGLPGRWRYQLSATPTTRALYDITEPHAPRRLVLPTGQATSFEDGPSARRYLLAGPGTTWTPTTRRHEAVDLTRPLDVEGIYIAPAPFHGALAPLLALRRAQGRRVAVVDLQSIYDTWNWGTASPNAIRQFLQYAVAHWTIAPAAATLVGDGTSDPHDYLGFHQPNLIPPYLAMVDPWMGETACESCFGQLDGTDPLSDPLPDLAIGRVPVASTDELRDVVAKLVAYETAPPDPRVQNRALFFTDNYREATGTADGAGDFAAFAERSVAQQPTGIEAARVYYDPYSATSSQPGHEPNADACA